jgi:DNA-binding MarR family transcriptional regulator
MDLDYSVKAPYRNGPMAEPARTPEPRSDESDPIDSDPIERALEVFAHQNVGVLFQQLARVFERRVRATLRARGHTELQPSHQVVFVSLGRSGTRLTDLARRAGMTKQAMGQIIDDLEELGYVERRPDPADRRAKIVRLTATGLEFVCDAADVLAGIWRDYEAVLGAEDLQHLQHSLRKLLRGARGEEPLGAARASGRRVLP